MQRKHVGKLLFSEEVTTPSRALPVGNVGYIGVGSPSKREENETVLRKSFYAATRLLQSLGYERLSNACASGVWEARNGQLHPVLL